MASAEDDIFRDHQRSNWLRLRTLLLLRWIAIAGQIAAVLVTVSVLHLDLATGPIAVTIGASIIANLLSTVLFPGNRRLTGEAALVILVFDVLQLGLLLFLTGGLNNPFAILLLGPVTIAATLLPLRQAAALAVLGVAVVLVLWRWYLPLVTEDGTPLVLPPLFLFGFWLALSIGLVFLSLYTRQVTTETHAMREALVATQLALAREQKLTDLGGVVAAAAHELGTPLATIKLVSAELTAELDGHPDQQEDARLIGQQADRCRDILRSMGRAGKEDRLVRRAPLEQVVREAAEPHVGRGIAVEIGCTAEVESGPDQQPIVWRRPEVVHGLRNLIQNAVDFASASVDVEVSWSATALTVRIEDDGPGFPQGVLARIGDPFVRRRRGEEPRRRPGYEGMGLGLFIAKTLLERTGARLTFANAGGGGGAVALVEWSRAALEAGQGEAAVGGLGPNRRLEEIGPDGEPAA
ncbi:sensor histidine kinase RegB [Wenxinia marina]|uniref:histidine kinase n=1 Tax=Wenxinia marina DSM 24838 TaxID=1123501 RepID=A0A0D0NS73_9RHOB|nr:ActS/PrrB/RegB family redox-sensitive histidine kinase [Wenxinia marina]KIQ71085.1 Signal transduction histidine kinase [Wenxinia marina DSM 24838]GGL54965.1 two-component sensor histidine kinase [Wenxinia marina]